ncbi:hypothetical protein [Pseudophaeobacter leonis]|uniref:hypothetical protein n=1 Tax=Pseudophaeobacter leonis TaxID=1144477 RepID=UPI00111BDD11|nr:hypothetical protein [Pseudophaeobacter leonis]
MLAGFAILVKTGCEICLFSYYRDYLLMTAIEEIDKNWLQRHLNGMRGAKAQLSRATGISPDKISKILTGTRLVQASEAPRIYNFFYPGMTQSASDADRELLALWHQLSPAERDFLLKSAKGLLSPVRLAPNQSGSEEK